MKPIEDLKMEHEAVKITLRVLESICNKADKAGEIANPDHLEQLIEFFNPVIRKGQVTSFSQQSTHQGECLREYSFLSPRPVE